MASTSLLNVALSFVFLWCILTRIGSNVETDALFLGLTLTQTIISIVGACIINVLTPILAAQDEARRRRSTGMFFLLCLAAMGLVSGSLCALSEPVALVLGPGLEGSSRKLAGELLAVMSFSIVMQCCAQVLTSNLYASKKFSSAEAAVLVSNVLSLTTLIFWLPRIGVAAAAWSVIVKHAVHAGLVMMKTRFSVIAEFDSGLIKEFLHRAKFLLVAGLYSKTDKVVDRFFASILAPGTLTLLHIAQQLYGAGHQVINRVYVNTLVPQMVASKELQDWKEFEKSLLRRAGLIMLIGATGYLAIVLFGEEILSLLVGYGEVTQESLRLLWILMVLCGGYCVMPPVGFLFASGFYVLGDTATPTRVAFLSTTLAIASKFVLFILMGGEGLAIGISLHYIIAAVLLFHFGAKVRGSLPGRAERHSL